MTIPFDARCLSAYYLFMSDIDTRALDRELKRGSAELLILSLLDARPRHGYDLSKLIETRSGAQLKFSHRLALSAAVLPRRAWLDQGHVGREARRAASTLLQGDG